MEATPKGLNVAQMVRDMIREPEVRDVHDLHVWSIAGGMRALSAHVQVADQPVSQCDPLLGRLGTMLQRQYQIDHATIQVECADCATTHLYCDLGPNANGEHDHEHTHERTSDGLDAAQIVTSQGARYE